MNTDVGAVVVGGDYQGLGIVRSLGRRGIPVCVIDDEHSIARFSRYATHAVHAASLRDERQTIDIVIDAGRRLGLRGWLLYPTRDETVAAFDQLVDAGKIRSWGVSNFDTDDLDELLAVAGDGKIACNQVLYHLGERAIEHAVIPWCEQHGVAVVAYSPFGHNDFPPARSKAGQALQAIAKAHGASPRQVALSFLTRATSVFAIPKASSQEHAADNAAAANLTLSESEIATLDEAFPRGPKPRSLPML